MTTLKRFQRVTITAALSAALFSCSAKGEADVFETVTEGVYQSAAPTPLATVKPQNSAAPEPAETVAATPSPTDFADDSPKTPYADEKNRKVVIPKIYAAAAELLAEYDYAKKYVFSYTPSVNENYEITGEFGRLAFDWERGEITLEAADICAPRISSDDGNFYINILTPREVYPKIVVIDAGHGGEDEGAIYGGFFEKDIAFAIAWKLYDLIEADGVIKAYMTRYGDETLHRSERAPIANALGDILVSLHCDVDEESTKTDGVHAIYATTGSRELGRFGIPNRTLGEILVDAVLDKTGADTLPIDVDDELTILMNAQIPAVLMELGYMTNAGELRRLTDENYRRLIAEGLYEGLIKAFESGEF